MLAVYTMSMPASSLKQKPCCPALSFYAYILAVQLPFSTLGCKAAHLCGPLPAERQRMRTQGALLQLWGETPDAGRAVLPSTTLNHVATCKQQAGRALQ